MKIHHLVAALACSALPFLSSCGSEDTPTPLSTGNTLTMTIGVASNAASAPASRVDHESGKFYENTIYNYMVLIYDAPLNKPASVGDGKIVEAIYVGSVPSSAEDKLTGAADGHTYDVSHYAYPDVISAVKVGSATADLVYTHTAEVPTLEVGKRYYAVALANMGDLTNTFKDKPLQTLRDYIYTGNLYTIGTKYKGYYNFAMSGINEVSFTMKSGENKVPTLLVQRLAARLDITFGQEAVAGTTTLASEGVYVDFAGDKVTLAVLDGTKTTDTKLEGKTFVLTDIKIVNDRNPSSGTYLIERSSSAQNGNNPEYFGNEAWSTADPTWAQKYIVPTPTPSYLTTYSVVNSDVNASDLQGLIFANYSNDDKKYSTIGYLTENIDYSAEGSAKYTTIQISGYTNASTSTAFQAPKRAVTVPNGYTAVTGQIVIRHSIPTNVGHESNPMANAVVRNTIYRILIKVYAMDNKIFFRYYYYGGAGATVPDNTNTYPATGFSADIQDDITASSSSPTTPND